MYESRLMSPPDQKNCYTLPVPPLSPEIEQRLHALVTAFLAENANINLSAFRTEETCWNGNVLDSVAVLDVIAKRAKQSTKILDLGTGGGFPLLPLAISLPHCHFYGVDSVQKKISAIDRIMKTLNLTNVSLICGRAEELGRDAAHREQYDFVTCRAVAEINVLVEYAAPFLKVGGTLLLWKSLTIDQELKDSLLARAELSCHLQDSYQYELPGDWGKRQILIFQKAAKTSHKYPREVGIPKKEPLK